MCNRCALRFLCLQRLYCVCVLSVCHSLSGVRFQLIMCRNFSVCVYERKRKWASFKVSGVCLRVHGPCLNKTHTCFTLCLGKEHAALVLEHGDCEQCELFTVKVLHAHLTYLWAGTHNEVVGLACRSGWGARYGSYRSKAHPSAPLARVEDSKSLVSRMNIEFATSELSSCDDKVQEELG